MLTQPSHGKTWHARSNVRMKPARQLSNIWRSSVSAINTASLLWSGSGISMLWCKPRHCADGDKSLNIYVNKSAPACMQPQAPKDAALIGVLLPTVTSLLQKKPLADLDSEYWLSPGHPGILDRLTKARKPSSRIPPLTFGAIVQAQSIPSVDAMCANNRKQATHAG